VFDEADRLFEMGFADQCKEILRQMPDRLACPTLK
jgi:superfamily II DNA/RNA helicase